jgi:DNA-binding winged helix-turn-helix (wHTH) protein
MAEATQLSSSGVHACCCASGSCSLTVFRSSSALGAFDLLLVLLEADGALVTKNELLNRVWPDIVVSEENLKVQISASRKGLGADRDLIRTEFGRGYRFIGILRSNATAYACQGPRGAKRRVSRALLRQNGLQSLQCGFNSSW